MPTKLVNLKRQLARFVGHPRTCATGDRVLCVVCVRVCVCVCVLCAVSLSVSCVSGCRAPPASARHPTPAAQRASAHPDRTGETHERWDGRDERATLEWPGACVVQWKPANAMGATPDEGFVEVRL